MRRRSFVATVLAAAATVVGPAVPAIGIPLREAARRRYTFEEIDVRNVFERAFFCATIGDAVNALPSYPEQHSVIWERASLAYHPDGWAIRAEVRLRRRDREFRRDVTERYVLHGPFRTAPGYDELHAHDADADSEGPGLLVWDRDERPARAAQLAATIPQHSVAL